MTLIDLSLDDMLCVFYRSILALLDLGCRLMTSSAPSHVTAYLLVSPKVLSEVLVLKALITPTIPLLMDSQAAPKGLANANPKWG